MLPEYACAVIEDARGWLLLQLRPPGARYAPALLTCFGGRIDDAETPERCLERELAEELAWRPPGFSRCCELWQGDRFIAVFFRTALGPDERPQASERGHVAVSAPWAALPGLPVSPWHRAVLAAVAHGQPRVDLRSEADRSGTRPGSRDG
ncbi:MAG: NUDIX domain-containing protein [Planctomycetes bacterium]|nr:NUDIX domain-containing protein [Planctomycetota bacterium]